MYCTIFVSNSNFKVKIDCTFFVSFFFVFFVMLFYVFKINKKNFLLLLKKLEGSLKIKAVKKAFHIVNIFCGY